MNKKNLIAAALVAAGVISSASADQTFHIYGSTAYRKATFAALNSLFTDGTVAVDNNGNVIASASLPIATPTSTQVGSTNLVWSGHASTIGSGVITIYANWAGSVGGVRSVADPAFASGNIYLASTTPSTGGALVASTVDLAMADCDQASTLFSHHANPIYPQLDESLVSVLEFVWAKGLNGPTNLVDVGPWSIQAALAQGGVDLSQFTGNTNDIGKFLEVVGRNSDSGTRILAEVDSFSPVANPVIQYLVDGTGNATFAGTGSDGLGDGYSSGGSVKTALNTTVTNAGTYELGYIAVTDAMNVNGFTAPAGFNTLSTTNTGGPAVPMSQWLNYNGVTWSEQAIAQGAYTYFGYEHCDIRTGAPAATKTFRDALKAKQILQAGTANVPGTMPISVMNLGQDRADGAVISHN